MGAKPSGILLSCVMPNNMKISDYMKFMEGINFLSNKFSCPVIGGNIKDGKSFDVNATIFGQAAHNHILRREGAKKNDKILVIGRLGEFWTSVLGIKHFINDYDEKQVDWFWEKIRRPMPKVTQGIFLAERNLATSCIDNSDGLTGCFYELAKKNKLDVIIEDDKIMRNLSPITLDVASKLKIDPVKLGLNWGDWQLICTVPESKYEHFKDEVLNYNQNNINEIFEFIEIGYLREIEAEKPQVKYIKNQREFILTNFENERFSHISYFTHGLNNYIKYLYEFELYTNV
jgi:thiamine-monophosphate kinase